MKRRKPDAVRSYNAKMIDVAAKTLRLKLKDDSWVCPQTGLDTYLTAIVKCARGEVTLWRH